MNTQPRPKGHQACSQLLTILLAYILTFNILLTSAANPNGFFTKHQTTKNHQTEDQWKNWLNKQEPKRLGFGGKNDPKSAMTTKGLNNVITANKQTILDAFNPAKGELKPFRDSQGNKMAWSNVPLPNIMIQNQNGNTRVFENPPLFVAAKLDKNNVPIHLSTSYNDRPSQGNANFAFAKNGKRLPTTSIQQTPLITEVGTRAFSPKGSSSRRSSVGNNVDSFMNTGTSISRPGSPQLAKSRPGSPQLAKSRPGSPQLAKSRPGSPQLAKSRPVSPQLAKSRPGSPQLVKSRPPSPSQPKNFIPRPSKGRSKTRRA